MSLLKDMDKDVWLNRAIPIVLWFRKPDIGAGDTVVALYRERLIVVTLRRGQDKPEGNLSTGRGGGTSRSQEMGKTQ